MRCYCVLHNFVDVWKFYKTPYELRFNATSISFALQSPRMAFAMKVIGSSSSVRRSAVVTAGPTKRSRTHQPALVLEDELVEEWIENDLPSPTRKPNKKSNYSLPVHKPSYQSDKEKTLSSSRPNKYKINQIEHCKIK